MPLPALVVAGDGENHRILWNKRLSDVEEHFKGQIEELRLGGHLDRIGYGSERVRITWIGILLVWLCSSSLKALWKTSVVEAA